MATYKALYRIAAGLLFSGLDSELDRYLNDRRSGKTPALAGYRYAVPKESRILVEEAGRKFGRLSTEETAAIREQYGSDTVVREQIRSGFSRLVAAKEDTPAFIVRFYDEPETISQAVPPAGKTRRIAAAKAA